MLFDRIEIENEYIPCKIIDLSFEKNLLIFGRNGTGKSTLVKSINLNAKADNCKVKFYNKNIEIETLENTGIKIHTYNDDFHSRNVSYSETGNFESIVMLGDQLEYQIKIDEQLKVEKEIIENIQKNDNKINENRKEMLLDSLKSLLKGDSSWSGNVRKIKGHRHNASVTTDVIKKILKSKNNSDYEVIKSELANLKHNITSSRSEEKIYLDFELPEDDLKNEEIISKILKKEIKPPIFTDREEVIMNILLDNGLNNIKKSKNIIENNEINYCPTCFQSLSNSYRLKIKESLIKVLENQNKDVLREEIIKSKMSLNHIDYLYKINEKISYEIQNNFINSLKEYNDEISKTRTLLESKENNIYQSIQESIGMNDKFDILKNTLEILKKEFEKYNKKFENQSLMIKEALKLNDELAYHQIKELYSDYLIEYNLYEELLEENKKLDKKLQRTIEYKNKLISLQKQTNIALDEINNNLALIFFDANRLSLEEEHGRYYVLSRGRKTKLNNLSIGEQNIISLCYFFSLINQNKRKKERYMDECLILLDDPLSSFDYENKLGIYNFLRMQFYNILSNNPSSRILITTHDMEVFLNVDKLFTEMPVKTNKFVLTPNNYEMKNNFSSTYTNMLNDLYLYANDKNDVIDSYVGNLMRRIFEAYTTFMYKDGIDGYRNNQEILSLIINTDEREYFKSFMFRLVLNNESHLKDVAANISSYNPTDYLTSEQKKITAKLLLVLMYRLNNLHLKRHIENFNKNKIKEWSGLIPKLLNEK